MADESSPEKSQHDLAEGCRSPTLQASCWASAGHGFPRAGCERDQSHGTDTSSIIHHRTTIYVHPTSSQHTEMGIRDSFSRLKDKLELKSKGRRPKPDGTGSGTDGEEAYPSGSLPRPAPSVAVGGHDGGGDGLNDDGPQVLSRDQLPRSAKPESAHDDQGGGADLGGGGVSQKRSHLRPDVEVVVASGLGQEEDSADREKLEQAHPSPSVPLISHSGKLDGM